MTACPSLPGSGTRVPRCRRVAAARLAAAARAGLKEPAHMMSAVAGAGIKTSAT